MNERTKELIEELAMEYNWRYPQRFGVSPYEWVLEQIKKINKENEKMAVKFDLSSESEKMTFIDLLNKIRKDDNYPLAIVWDGCTYNINDGDDYVDYGCILGDIGATMNFSDLFLKREFTLVYYRTITYIELLDMIKKGTQPQTIYVENAKYNYLNGDYWMETDGCITSALTSIYTTKKLIGAKIKVNE